MHNPVPKQMLHAGLLLLALFLAIPVFASADTVGPNDVRSGSLLLRMQEGYRVSTLLNTDVEINVTGLVARVTVRQAFRNEGAEWAEGVYVFPLPDRAAVDHMRLYIGERFIEGDIREKEQARKEYEQARSEGRKASLVEQQRANLFTTSVANIAPGEKVVVEIEYLEDLVYDSETFSLRFPLTLTPRYIPGSPTDPRMSDRVGSGWVANTDQVTDASLITPPMVSTSTDHRVGIRATIDAGVALQIVASRYHPVHVSDDGNRYHVELAGGTAPMDHDFELLWRPVPDASPRALIFNETIGGDPHFLLMVIPPGEGAGSGAVIPREMIFVIDTSGSMHGTSIRQAKKALLRAIDGLRANDRFNVIAFNSYPDPLFPASVPADTFNLNAARSFVNSLQSNGGTEMAAALRLALGTKPRETHLRQLVFITDGAVGNEDALFKLIESRLGSGRLFTVGIGSAPNSWFMRKAAEAGRGTFTTISALNEVGEKMDRLFAKLESPQVTDIDVRWPSGVIVESYPGVVPDLYLGEPVGVKARITGSLRASDVVEVSGNSVAGAWNRELPLRGIDNRPGIGALWARSKIGALMDDERRGNDAAGARLAIVNTALAHHLVSKYTSLVAVDRTPARPLGDALRSDQVPNLMAHGQSTSAIFGFPATATSAPRLRAAGIACIVLALLLLSWGRLSVPGRRDCAA